MLDCSVDITWNERWRSGNERNWRDVSVNELPRHGTLRRLLTSTLLRTTQSPSLHLLHKSKPNQQEQRFGALVVRPFLSLAVPPPALSPSHPHLIRTPAFIIFPDHSHIHYLHHPYSLVFRSSQWPGIFSCFFSPPHSFIACQFQILAYNRTSLCVDHQTSRRTRTTNP